MRTLPTAVTHFSSGGVAIRYVLLVLWMASCLRIMAVNIICMCVCVCVRVAVWHLVAQILYFIGALLVLLALVFSQMQLCCRRERASTIRTLSGILLFSCENTSQLTVV